jgi:hypothetical protein
MRSAREALMLLRPVIHDCGGEAAVDARRVPERTRERRRRILRSFTPHPSHPPSLRMSGGGGHRDGAIVAARISGRLSPFVSVSREATSTVPILQSSRVMSRVRVLTVVGAAFSCVVWSCARTKEAPPVQDRQVELGSSAPAVTPVPVAPVTPAKPAQSGESIESDDSDSAVAVLHAYYDAINSGEYEAAYEMWGSAGPPKQTLKGFAAGFADTASVEMSTGPPSRIEGAAGSRYITVPVVIGATTKRSAIRRFRGTYTLRRSVVDGASSLDRKWHIDQASIRAE